MIAILLGGQSLNAPTAFAQLDNAEKSTRHFEHFLQVRATAATGGVAVEWRTGLEKDILGFNVFRVRNGRRVQLNPGLIAGSAFVTRGRTDSYSWFDPTGTADTEYFVEAIDLKGETAVASSAVPVWGAALPSLRQAELLSNLGGPRANSTQSASISTEQEKENLQASDAGTVTESIADQWALANQPALRIGVRTEGWYRITQPAMAAASFDTTGDARNLRLFVGGGEIAMRVSRDAGTLGSSDFIEFWGKGLDTPTTDTQVYWLINGSQPGVRIVTKGELTIESSPTVQLTPPPNNATAPSSSWLMGFPGVIAQAVRPERNEAREIAPRQADEKKLNSLPFVQPDVASDEAKKKAEPLQPIEATTLTASSSDVATPELVTAKAFIAEAKPSVPTKAARSNSKRTMLRSAKSRRRRPNSKLRRRNHFIAAATAPAFVYSAQRKDHNIYYSAALNGERENFFGPVVFGDGPVVTMTLRNIETTSSAPAQLQVALQGVSIEPHLVKVFVNGSLAGTVSFADETSTAQTFTIPTSWLVDGDNAVKLAPVASIHDTSVVEYVRVTYPHSFRAENDSLQFSVKSTQSARIEGFATSTLRVLDITDPAAVQEVRPAVEASGGGFAATIPSFGGGKARRMVALPASSLSQPAWLILNQPSTLNFSSNAANFVIVAHKDFIPALATLVAQRHAQGYTVAVVNVEDVFDEFSYGAHSPQAIRDFMSLAKNSWTSPPSYLLLVGDATYDPRNYLGGGNNDFVPTKLIDTQGMETGSDDWLADINGVGLTNLAVGRLP
ncbi:MAG: C25 family cysteine peptidase, partial [Pyrinomonadaceae bacterium]